MKNGYPLAGVLVAFFSASCVGDKGVGPELSVTDGGNSTVTGKASNENQSVENTVGGRFTPLQSGGNPGGFPQSVGDWELVGVVCTDESPGCRAEGIVSVDEGVLALYSMGEGSRMNSTVISGNLSGNLANLKPPLVKLSGNGDYAIDSSNEVYNLRTGQYEIKPANYLVEAVTGDGALIGSTEAPDGLPGSDRQPPVYKDGSLFSYDGPIILEMYNPLIQAPAEVIVDPAEDVFWQCGFGANLKLVCKFNFRSIKIVDSLGFSGRLVNYAG